VRCGETSDDIDATAACLTALGAEVSYNWGEGFSVKPLKPRGQAILDCGESGSTLRFMLPICCALGVSAEFHMRGRLPSRPMSPLLEELTAHGCTFDGVGGSPLKTSGKLRGGEFNLPGNVTSQFISGLLFALPLLDCDSRINVAGRLESEPYIDMTLDALRVFGIKVESEDGYYVVRGGQKYRSPGTVHVEGDWSNAAFWLCAGAIGKGGMTCTGLNFSSKQGDMAILNLLKRFGAEVTCSDNTVTVKPADLCGIRIDASDTPDLVPILSVVASVAHGETVIYNAERLRIKESDRLRTVTETLRALGADIAQTPDGLTINGKKALHGGTVSSFGDHRIAMTAAVASRVCEGPVIIDGAEAVDKSYPGFWEDFSALGGVLTED